MEARNQKSGLTFKREKFAKGLAAGMTQVAAYRAAYNASGNQATDIPEASRLAHLDEIKARLAELQAQADAGAVANLEQIAADLYRIAGDESKPDGVRLKAYDQLIKMQGGYTDNYNISARGSIGIAGIEDTIADMLED